MTTTNTTPLEGCEAYKKLEAAVAEDLKREPNRREYSEKLVWIAERAKHYAEKTGLNAVDILEAWEKRRDYWHMNFYQDAEQPLIEGDSVRVFETTADMLTAIGKPAFRCPACDGVSNSPYTCDSGKKRMETKGRGKKATQVEGKVCDWKVYGLFRDLGKGVYVFVKAEMRGERIFKPVAWEAEVR